MSARKRPAPLFENRPGERLTVADTDMCLASALRDVATLTEWSEANQDTIRTLALSAAYRLEKLANAVAAR
jgi:hypothetical protein